MGYERKLFVVSEYNNSEDPERNWAEDIAMFDVCKVDKLFDVKWEKAKATMFALDGETRVKEDRYGAQLLSADPEEVAAVLEDVYKKTGYWRAKVAADLIREIKETCNTRDNIRVYSFGY